MKFLWKNATVAAKLKRHGHFGPEIGTQARDRAVISREGSMDFAQATGLAAETLSGATPQNTGTGGIAQCTALPLAQIWGKSPALLPVLITPPDPELIALKFLRLQRYCATRLRLLLAPEPAAKDTSGAQSHKGKHGSQLRFVIDPEGAMGEGQETGTALADFAGHLALLAGLLELAGLEAVQLHLSQRTRRAEIRWQDAPQVAPLRASSSIRLSDHVLTLIGQDPARAWRIDNAAAELGLSGRSLQRYLQAEGSSFSEVLRQARTAAAERLLERSPLSLAEIGFCCGYADQAHFQREFRRMRAMTPRHFRQRKAG